MLNITTRCLSLLCTKRGVTCGLQSTMAAPHHVATTALSALRLGTQPSRTNLCPLLYRRTCAPSLCPTHRAAVHNRWAPSVPRHIQRPAQRPYTAAALGGAVVRPCMVLVVGQAVAGAGVTAAELQLAQRAVSTKGLLLLGLLCGKQGRLCRTRDGTVHTLRSNHTLP